MATIYTRSGDGGHTSLATGQRIKKNSLRVESYGTIDELQAVLGLARSCADNDDVKRTLYTAQSNLIHIMAEVATPGSDPRVSREMVIQLEQDIDRYNEALPQTFEWRIAGNETCSAALNLARTVARRAERLCWALSEEENEDPAEYTMAYLNRTSDLCYVLSMYCDPEINGCS